MVFAHCNNNLCHKGFQCELPKLPPCTVPLLSMQWSAICHRNRNLQNISYRCKKLVWMRSFEILSVAFEMLKFCSTCWRSTESLRVGFRMIIIFWNVKYKKWNVGERFGSWGGINSTRRIKHNHNVHKELHLAHHSMPLNGTAFQKQKVIESQRHLFGPWEAWSAHTLHTSPWAYRIC